MANLTRRAVLKTGCAALGGRMGAASGIAVPEVGEKDTVRDRLWLFGCPANSDFLYLNRRSLMTAAEAAFYLAIPNLIIVQASIRYPRDRFHPPFAQYAIALRPFRRIAWSIVGSGGFTDPAETREVIELAKRTPNFAGIMLDDFFHSRPRDNRRAVLGVEELRAIRDEIRAGGKKLDIFATFYTSLFELQLADYLELIDVITFWTWESMQLTRLDENFARLEKAAPKARKLLGCYLYDFSRKQPVEVRLMERQCTWALKGLETGKIDGVVFLANTVADLGFESVEWAREWIRDVGDRKL